MAANRGSGDGSGKISAEGAGDPASTDPGFAWRRATTASRSGDGYTLSGTKTLVLDGHIADLLLVIASTDNGPSLFAVEADASGLTRRSLETLDMTRKVAALEFSGTPARLVGEEGAAAGILERTLQHAVVALAAPASRAVLRRG